MGKYSVYLSVLPATVSSSLDEYGNAVCTLPDSSFMYIGTSDSFQHNFSYTAATTGILGTSTSNAIFVDGTGGAVGKVSVSSVRVQPATPSDPSSSTIQISGDYSNISNRKFFEVIKQMKEKIQMFNNAYVLRIYNIDRETGSYHDIPVFISNYQCNIALEKPNQVSISLTLIQRNIRKGFN